MTRAGFGMSVPGLLPLIVLLALLLLAPACAIQPDGQELSATTTRPTADVSPQPSFTRPPSTVAPTLTSAPSLSPTWTPQSQPTVIPSPLPAATPTSEACDEPGRIVHARFPSALAWPDLAYRIYLPPCYGRDGRAYPVLYVLGGNIHDDSIWDQLGLDEAAETAIQTGLMPPLLIVMPTGGQIANQTSGGPYSYEGVIMNELLPHVESNYCAWPEPAGRAIGGLSRGGYWALEIAFRQSANFASVGGHGAALVDTYAGPALDPKYTALSNDLAALRIYLDAGQDDWYLAQLQILHDNLLSAGREHAWIIQEGGHNNTYWAAHVADYLAWYTEPWSRERADYPPCGVGGG